MGIMYNDALSSEVWELLSTIICLTPYSPIAYIYMSSMLSFQVYYYKHLDFTATCQLSVDKMSVYQLKFLLSPIFDRIYVCLHLLRL